MSHTHSVMKTISFTSLSIALLVTLTGAHSDGVFIGLLLGFAVWMHFTPEDEILRLPRFFMSAMKHCKDGYK